MEKPRTCAECERLRGLAFDSQAREGFLRNRLQQLQFAADHACCSGDCPHEESRLCVEALVEELQSVAAFASRSLRGGK